MRVQVVIRPWLPSPAGDLTHRHQVDTVTHCCSHSVLQELGTGYCTGWLFIGKLGLDLWLLIG